MEDLFDSTPPTETITAEQFYEQVLTGNDPYDGQPVLVEDRIILDDEKKWPSSLIIRNYHFHDHIGLYNLANITVTFYQCSFYQQFRVDNGTQVESLAFDICSFERLIFEGGEVPGYISIHEIRAKYVEIHWDLRQIKKNITFSRGYINKVNLSYAMGNTIRFTGVTADAFALQGYIRAKIILSGLVVKTIGFNGYEAEESMLQIEDLNPRDDSTSFGLWHSNMSNCEILNCNLNGFKKVTIQDSFVSKMTVANIRWKKTIEANGLEKQRETYRQLKTLMKRHNNRVMELHFAAKEMEVHYQSLSWKIDFIDKFILATSKWSNKFGQNWLLPIFWLLLVGFSFFFLVVYCSSIGLKAHWGSYFTFLNPTHKVNFIPNHTLSNASMTIDFISRVILAYFYFQTVVAFRKFVKR